MKLQSNDFVVVAPVAIFLLVVFLSRCQIFNSAAFISVAVGPFGIFSAAWATIIALPGAIWLSRSAKITQVFRWRWLYCLTMLSSCATLGLTVAGSRFALDSSLAVMVILLFRMLVVRT